MNKQKAIFLKTLSCGMIFYIIFASYRFVFIINNYFSTSIQDDTLGSYFKAFGISILHDSNVIAILSIFILLVALLSSSKPLILKILCIVIVFGLWSVNVASISFFNVYGNIFDIRFIKDILGLSHVFSGLSALKIFLWLIPSILFAFLVSFVFDFIDKKCVASDFLHTKKSTPKIFGLFGLLIGLIFAGLYVRASEKYQNNMSAFLFQTAKNPLKEMYSIYCSYNFYAKKTFANYSAEDLDTALLSLYKDKHTLDTSAYEEPTKKPTIGDVFLHHVSQAVKEDSRPTETQDIGKSKGLESIENQDSINPILQTSPKITEPKNPINHIFYIIVPELNTLYFDKKIQELDISHHLNKIAKEGFNAHMILQNGKSLSASIDSIISGLLDIDIPLKYVVLDTPPKSAPAMILKNLGFEGHIYHNKQFIWNALNSYVLDYGFSKLFSLKDIETQQKYKYEASIEELFKLVQKNVLTNPSKKTFNLIITPSLLEFKPDSRVQGFKNSDFNAYQVKTFLQVAKLPSSLLANLEKLYSADLIIGEFIENISKTFKDSLFIITGHNDMQENSLANLDPSKNPNTSIGENIPLIIYSPSLKPNVISFVGSQIDIIPTIIDLIAPDGFSYLAIGESLLSNKYFASTKKRDIFGNNLIAKPHFTFDGAKFFYVNEALKYKDDLIQAKKEWENLNRTKALNWYILSQAKNTKK